MARLLIPLLLLGGCSGPYAAAGRLEAEGRLLDAAEAYVEAAKARPRASWAPGSLAKGAALFERLGDCVRGRPALERLARAYPEPWPALAKAALMDCPSYLPTEAGQSWVYGDSATGGRNMRSEVAVSTGGAAAELRVRLFAGDKPVREGVRLVRKADWRVEESVDASSPTVVLRYPYRAGTEWGSVRQGRPVRFKVEADDARVEVRGGRYERCLKVREQAEGLPSWTVTYYAPGVGPVLSAVAGPDYENRNVELLEHHPPSEAARP